MERTRSSPTGTVAAVAILASLAGTLLWLSMLSGPWKLVTGLLDSAEHIKKAEKKLSAGLLKDARYETLAGAAAADRARDGYRTGGPLLDIASAVSRVKDIYGEVEHFVSAAELSSDAALGTLDVAQNALRGPDKIIAKDPNDPKEGSIIRIERVRAIAKIVSDVRDDIVGVKEELEAVDTSVLPRRLRPEVVESIDKAKDTDELLADAEAGFEILPGFLGADGPRTYLFGMQNSGEQRGPGGALLQFALMSIANGKPQLAKDASTIYDVDENRDPVSIPLPEDAWYVANITDAQRFGNANWSPDWPLSGTLTVEYAKASEPNFPDVDGVIAVDPVVMEKLMPGVGAYRSDRGTRISTRKVLYFLLYRAYAVEPIPKARRNLLRSVVDGFYERMLKPDHPSEMVQGFGDSLAQKHMQIWLRDPAEQAFIERMNWDGAIQTARNSDFMYAVEQNVGGNKLDYFADNEVNMDVELDGADAKVSTEMRVRNGIFLPQPRWSMGDSGPIHRPMLNLYVPANAELQGSSFDFSRTDGCLTPDCHLQTPQPAIWVNGQPPTHFEKGKKVWSATIEVLPSEEGSVTFDYLVPGVVRTKEGRSTYRLVIQHQPKVRPDMLNIKLAVPEGAKDVRAPGWKKDGKALVYSKSMKEDIVLEVSWRS